MVLVEASNGFTYGKLDGAFKTVAARGRVGAGGLGQQMDNSMKMFQGGEVATMLLVFMMLVGLADYASARLRKVLA